MARPTGWRSENQELKRRLRTSGLDRNRVQELDDLLHLAGAGRYRVLPAQVIAIGSAQTFSWTVTLDAGSRDGIRPDMTVLNGDGLVGRVKTVGPSTATVLLAVDPESSVGVRLEGSMEVGFTTGQGIADDGDLDLQLLDGQSTVERGDRLVTFGSQGATPYVPVSRLARSSPSRARRDRRPAPPSSARTSTSPRSTWWASWSSRRARDPRDAVLPPQPSATPTPTVTVTVTPSPTARG